MELWQTDSTETGTVIAKDINPGVANSNPDKLTNVSGALFFAADDGTRGVELFVALTGSTTIISGGGNGCFISTAALRYPTLAPHFVLTLKAILILLASALNITLIAFSPRREPSNKTYVRQFYFKPGMQLLPIFY